MTLVTYIPRFLPIFLLMKLDIPKWLIKWLKYVPVGILSSLLAPSIFIINGNLNFTIHNSFFLASIPCFVVAIVKKNIFLTVFTGIVVYTIFELL